MTSISVIITAHNEGLVAHKCMLSVLEACKKLADNNITYEIIVSLDRPSQATADYFKRYSDKDGVTLLTVNYGNVADSRNYAISQSQGKYVALLDGDDMITPNWYLESYHLAEQKLHDGRRLFALHPHVQLQYNDNNFDDVSLWVMGDSLGKTKDAIMMVQFNQWVSAIFAPREVFSQVKYVRPINGYGYEDYWFNCETTAAGILHYVTPHTVFFYRSSANGKQAEHIREHTVLPPTKLFDAGNLVDASKLDIPRGNGKKIQRRTYLRKLARPVVRQVSKLPIVREKIMPMVRKKIYDRRRATIPEWVISAWCDINHIENGLWPTKSAIIKMDNHPLSFARESIMSYRSGLKYTELASQFTKKPDYIFFTYDPLGAGGTEKVLFNYARAIKKAHPDWHLAVMRKRPQNCPFDIQNDIDFVDFLGATEGMNPTERNIILDRLIVQSRARRLHCFFNGWASGDFVYNWVRRHQTLLINNGYKIYVSWFMREYVDAADKGRIMTFADPYLADIYGCVSKVFTDNKTIIKQTLLNNAFDDDRFIVHYQPLDSLDMCLPKKINTKSPLRILWAGRLAYQKRPDILKKISNKLYQTNKNYVIDVYGREQHFRGEYFNGLPNVKYCGQFEGLSSIDTNKYDLFLYTSEVDGLPNVLLEATQLGLPVVASDDGGVGELIKTGKTGELVQLNDIDGYVMAINKLYHRPEMAAKYVRNAQKVLVERHSQDGFDNLVKRDCR